jgi:uncharacterized UPF0160 family protein
VGLKRQKIERRAAQVARLRTYSRWRFILGIVFYMKKVATHDGSFHSDDVFAIAALQLLLGENEVEVVRVPKDSPSIEADYVVDVGGVYDHERRRYDHHQPGAPVRENGIPYAAFGLVWRHYGADICVLKR